MLVYQRVSIVSPKTSVSTSMKSNPFKSVPVSGAGAPIGATRGASLFPPSSHQVPGAVIIISKTMDVGDETTNM